MLSFPPFRLDLGDERLWKDGQEVRLRRKPFAILRHLAQHPNHLVTHAEIVEAVWGKVAMSESLLRTHIRDLRQALGDEIVETVVGRGYRFVADVEQVQDASPREGWARLAPPAIPLIVGRAEQLEALSSALERARQKQRGIAFITGEPGIGKTTLVDGFIERARAGSKLFIARGTCIEQHGSGETYLPVIEALRNLCRGPGGERVIDLLIRHAPTWIAQMRGIVPPDRYEQIAPGASGATPGSMPRELAEALEAISMEAPVVLALDDLQWSDHSTVDLISMLGRRREPARILILGTYRPAEIARAHPLTKASSELVVHKQAQAIPLESLDEEALLGYLTKRFPENHFPPDLARTLHRSTGGNPLFIATLLDDLESVRMIRSSSGAWELSATVADVAARRPDSIRRLIDTQIDRLGADQQRILEAASVVGLTFAVGLAAHALDRELDDVETSCESLADEHRFLRYIGTDTWPDGTIQSCYAFAHALFQHAALERNPSATIRLLHRRIGERLELGHRERSEDIAGELALHFDEGQQVEKAARYHLIAGERAAARFGNVEARGRFERAKKLLMSCPEGQERDRLELRVLHGLGPTLIATKALAAEDLIPTFERAVELAKLLEDHRRLLGAWIGLQRSRLLNGELVSVSEHADDVAEIARQLGDPVLCAGVAFVGGNATFVRGLFGEAERYFTLARSFARSTGPQAEPIVSALIVSSLLAWITGRPDEAVKRADEARREAEALGDPFAIAAALCDAAKVRMWRGEPELAEALAARALKVAEEEPVAMWKAHARSILQWATLEKDPSAAVTCAEQLISDSRSTARIIVTLHALTSIIVFAHAGLEERALEEIKKTLEFAEETDERFVEPELHRLRGELLKTRDPDEAERAVRAAIALARRQGSVGFELRATMSLFRLVTGKKRQQAREELRRLLACYTEGQDTRDLIEARTLLSGQAVA